MTTHEAYLLGKVGALIRIFGPKHVLRAVNKEIQRQEALDVLTGLEAGVPLWKMEQELDRRENQC